MGGAVYSDVKPTAQYGMWLIACGWGCIPLHHMIDRGHDSKLQNMADFNLVRACERGDIEEVQDLLRKYKNPREVRSGYYDETLLHIACRFV